MPGVIGQTVGNIVASGLTPATNPLAGVTQVENPQTAVLPLINAAFQPGPDFVSADQTVAAANAFAGFNFGSTSFNLPDLSSGWGSTLSFSPSSSIFGGGSISSPNSFDDGSALGAGYQYYPSRTFLGDVGTEVSPVIVTARRQQPGIVEQAVNGVGGFLLGIVDGFGQAGLSTLEGIGNTVLHPILTAEALGSKTSAAFNYAAHNTPGQALTDAEHWLGNSVSAYVHGIQQGYAENGIGGAAFAAGKPVGAAGFTVASTVVGGEVLQGLRVAGVGGVVAAETADVGALQSVDSAFGCFVEGTLIHTQDGLTPIERLRPGDFVLSQPEVTGAQAYRRINDTFVFDDRAIFEITYRDVGGRSETLLATPNHPFWVKGVGWTGAEHLVSGQTLELNDGGDAVLTSVRDTGAKQRVYNFEVDGFHTYYVGELGAWVHNANCGLVYRAGSASDVNLTPRPVDVGGLSTFDSPDYLPPGTKYQIIDTSQFESLDAIPDTSPLGHVSITPQDSSLMEEWISSRGNYTHGLTQQIMDAIVGTGRTPK